MKWIDSYLDQGQLENISLSSVNNPNLKLSHLIFSLVNNPKLKLNHLIFSSVSNPKLKVEPSDFDEHSSDLFAVPHQADLDNWESNNTLPIEKKNQRYSNYRDNKNLPLYGTKNSDVEEIFLICLLEDIPEEKCVKEKPLRIKHTSTFCHQTRSYQSKTPIRFGS